MSKSEMDGFQSIVDSMVDLKRRKSEDYKETWRIFGIDGIYCMIAKKFGRLWANKHEKTLANESIRDTLNDMAIYCIMAMQLIDENDTEDKVYELLNK
jgi:hypothetical protein